jgi:hypothetical protein
MQGIWVFADATARDAAVTSPQEGNTCYLKSTDDIMVYSGSAWVTKSSTAASATPVNLLLNSNFALNQRAYVSAANLASGSYGFDRWKSNYTNTTLTFTASTQGQSITINSAGGLQQVIEQGLVPSGTYTLSWTGTATGRVYNSGATPPSYAASPVTFTADGSNNVVVEFTASGGTKTLSKVQFNVGTNTTYALATPTLQTELAACQRYYQKSYDYSVIPGASFPGNYTVAVSQTSIAVSDYYSYLTFKVTFRAAPTVTIYSGAGTLSRVTSISGSDAAANSGTVNSISSNGFGLQNTSAGALTPTGGGFLFFYTASSEL